VEYRSLGRTGLRVSALCLGAMTFGRETGETETQRMLDAFLDVGGNFVDTADVYAAGASETLLGSALAGRRDDVVLATKVRWRTAPGPNNVGLGRKHVLAGLDASLRRLRTDYVDLYQVHGWDDDTPLEETMGVLNEVVTAGKVRYLGCSNFAGWQLAKANEIAGANGWARFVSLQPQYSLVVRDIERELLPLCRYDGIAVLPWSPLGSGVLTGKYDAGVAADSDTRVGRGDQSAHMIERRVREQAALIGAVRKVAADLGRTPAQVALNWVLYRPGVTSPIIGARHAGQLAENLGALDFSLQPDEVAALDEASAIELGYPYDLGAMMRRHAGGRL
jgi:aryl-alcohol dehydrogenase-like predicted oxidoreductase